MISRRGAGDSKSGDQGFTWANEGSGQPHSLPNDLYLIEVV